MLGWSELKQDQEEVVEVIVWGSCGRPARGKVRNGALLLELGLSIEQVAQRLVIVMKLSEQSESSRLATVPVKLLNLSREELEGIATGYV